MSRQKQIKDTGSDNGNDDDDEVVEIKDFASQRKRRRSTNASGVAAAAAAAADDDVAELEDYVPQRKRKRRAAPVTAERELKLDQRFTIDDIYQHRHVNLFDKLANDLHAAIQMGNRSVVGANDRHLGILREMIDLIKGHGKLNYKTRGDYQDTLDEVIRNIVIFSGEGESGNEAEGGGGGGNEAEGESESGGRGRGGGGEAEGVTFNINFDLS